MLLILFILLGGYYCLIFYIYYLVRKDREKIIYLDNNDKRRGIIRIDNKIVKISNNTNYTGGYEIESYIYRYLGNDKNIVKCYNSKWCYAYKFRDNYFLKLNTQSEKLWVSISNDNQNKKFFYMVLSFDPMYIPLCDLIDLYKTRLGRREIIRSAIKGILKVIYKLNTKHGFYHGDLHTGNVLINKTTQDIKLYDFDFSGILNNVYNTSFVDYNEGSSEAKRLINLFLTKRGKRAQKFMFFADVYKLIASLIFYDLRYLGKMDKSPYKLDIFTGLIIKNIDIGSIARYIYNKYENYQGVRFNEDLCKLDNILEIYYIN